MAFLEEYIHGNWRRSAFRTLGALLEKECALARKSSMPTDEKDFQLDGVLEKERATIERVFDFGEVPCLPGDEIEKQRAEQMREQQNPSVDAYVPSRQGAIDDKSLPLILLECKYRVRTGNVRRNNLKTQDLYGELCRKFEFSRRFLVGEDRGCCRTEIVVFNSTAVDDMRDALESLCIGEGRSVFKVVDTEKLASSGLIGMEVTK